MQGIRREFDKLYKFSILFPAAVVLICWILYYSLGHWNQKYLPTISVTVIEFPENIIFCVGMSIESFILSIFLIIRHEIFIFQYGRVQFTIGIFVKHSIFIITGIISIIGLILLSSVTLKDNFKIHNLSASFFFFGSFLHYFFVDSLFFDTGTFLRKSSEYMTYSIIVCAFVYMFFLSIENDFFKSFAALLQYTCCILIFVKIYLIQHDLPRHIILTKVRINNVNELRN